MAIRRNTIQCIQAILEATAVLGIQLEGGDEAVAAATRVVNLDEGSELTPEVVEVRVCVFEFWVSVCLSVLVMVLVFVMVFVLVLVFLCWCSLLVSFFLLASLLLLSLCSCCYFCC